MEIRGGLVGAGACVCTGTGAEGSDVGGEGGVGTSEAIDDVDFVGGVAIVGDDAEVMAERSEVGDCGLTTPWSRTEGLLKRCLSVADSA